MSSTPEIGPGAPRVHRVGPHAGPPPPRPGGSRPRWRFAVFAAVLLLPIAEIFLFVAAGRTIGIWWTIGLLFLMSIVGAWLMKREGASTWRSLHQALQAGRVPGREAADAALILIGGALLLLPGFLTDVVGLFLILPFTRPLARRLLQQTAEKRVMQQAGIVRSIRVDTGSTTTVNGDMPHIDLRRGGDTR